MHERLAEDAASRRARFGQALSAALRSRGMTQSRLGAELDGMAQSAISAWTTGTAVPGSEVVFRLEKVMNLPGGFLSRHLGYLPVGERVPCSVEDAIQADPLLSGIHRQALLALYREFTHREGSDT